MAIAFLAATTPLRSELLPPLLAPEVAPPRIAEPSAPAGRRPALLVGGVAGLALAAAAAPQHGRRQLAASGARAGRAARAASGGASQAVKEVPADVEAPAEKAEASAAAEVEEQKEEEPEEVKAAEVELLALPFLETPAYRSFVRNVPGDAGFDPLGLAGNSPESFLRMFDAELKHGRLAMLAFAGFGGAEIFHEALAEKLKLPDLIAENGCTPTFLNGGLGEPLLLGSLVPILGLAAFLELASPPNTSLPGYYGFDPLGFSNIKFSDLARSMLRSDVEWVAEAEMKHGRLAMLAIIWCLIEEAVTGEPTFPEL